MKNILPSPLQYKKNTLYFAGKSLEAIAANKRTPFYLYSKKTLRHYYEYFSKSAAKNGIVSPLVCYALKANSNKEVLSTLKTLGSGADVVSVGELKKALELALIHKKSFFQGLQKLKKKFVLP